VPADDSRRFVIAAGTEHYDDGDELASVPEDLRKMVGFFGGLGYREQLPEVRLDPTTQALRSKLSDWLTGSDRRPSDTAVIYYSGHGTVQAGYFYLLTADSKEDQCEATALPADYVLRVLSENPRVRRVMLILDACYAGQGGFDAASVAARMSPWQNFGDGEGIWIVTAAGAKQEAQEALFADAFIEAAKQLQQKDRSPGRLQRYIGLDSLMEQVNAILKSRGKHQLAGYMPVTRATGLAPFIPNPHYEPDAPANVDLETRDWLRRRHATELAEYWGPKARGVEVAAQAGWYFTGRQAALVELTGWFADPSADTRLRILTGDPGSGKSAVLGRLVTLADPSSSPNLRGTTADPSAMPRVGSITAALLAKGKTADELLGELAAGLHVAAGAELPGAVRTRPVFTVVIDALDEASDPPSVIEKVISPLCSAASPGSGPRLLVATRRYQHLFGSLPASRVTVDLDQDAYSNDADVADYVTKVLLAADDPDSPTPYRDQPKLSREVAGQVAAIAGHSFLIAQIAARTLARTPRALDSAEVAADRERWRDVGTAFDRDLDRYGEKAHRVRDLLTPLAWAEGTGLPRDLWAPVATALADDQNYADDDIPWLIEQAGFYLVEALDQDRSVYRLYHEQFAEHLRAALSPSSAQQRITGELLRHVPVSPDGRREWLAAALYIRAHLATHAGKGQVLDQLVNDPGFLLAADPARLLPALSTITDPEARKSASAFESVHYLLPGRPPRTILERIRPRTLGEAAAQLDLAARVHGATLLVDGISRLPFERPWTIAWGHWARPDRHILLGRHTDGVRAVAVGRLDGAPIAVSGGGDCLVRLWDLRTGAARGEPLRGQDAIVTALAVGHIDGVPVAVSGGDFDGTVRVWDLRTGRARGTSLHCGTRGVAALAVGEVDGTPVVISSDRNGVVGVWDLRTGAARGKPLHRGTRGVAALAVGEVDGTPVAVSGGDDGAVRVWDLRTGAAHGQASTEEADSVAALAVGEVDGIPVAVSGGRDGIVRVWDLRTGAAHGNPVTSGTGSVAALAVGEVDGIPVAVSGGGDGAVRMWDLRTGAAHGDGSRDRADPVAALAVEEVDGTPVAVGRALDGTVRVWDLQTGAVLGNLRGYAGLVTALAAGTVEGTPVVVGGSLDGTVRVWDLRTRAACGEPLPGHTGMVAALAVGDVDGVPVAVSGGADGSVRVWDLRIGAAHGKPLLPGGAARRMLRRLLRSKAPAVTAVAVGEIDGAPVAVSGWDGWGLAARVWDLRTGVERGKLYGDPGGVAVLAVGQVDDFPVAVSGSRNWQGKVQVWDLLTGELRDGRITRHTGGVTALAIGKADGTLVAVSGDGSGTISMSALDRSQHVSARLDALSGVRAIAYGGQAGWLIATNDGSLFLWRPAQA